MTSVRSDQLHASRNVVSIVCCDWLVFPEKEFFLNFGTINLLLVLSKSPIHLCIISLIWIKTMAAREKTQI